jgi:hypothetical protein
MATVSSLLYRKKDKTERGYTGVFILNFFLPWNVLDTINVELVGDVTYDHRLELLPMAR